MEWLALVSPPLLWAKATWLSPFQKTHRHGLSGILSLISGGLMFASLHLDGTTLPILFIASALALLAMFAALWWPCSVSSEKRTDR